MFIEAGAVAIHFATFLALILLSCEVNSLMSNEVVIGSKDTPTLIAHFLVLHEVTVLDKTLSTLTALERPFLVVHSAMIKKGWIFP